jgi:hypothetical protein
MMVFETTDSFRKETPTSLYVIYKPANKTATPRSQITLLLLICMRLEKKAIPNGYISRIIIPRTISYIGENAFNDCKNIRVTLQINYDDEATLEVITWLQSVEISPIGNDDLVDVLTFKRPAIGFTQYEDIVE